MLEPQDLREKKEEKRKRIYATECKGQSEKE